jgi:L-cysteine/cystine lyase
MTFEEARAAFPVLERYAYLNAGSVGPLGRATADAMAAAERRELEHGRGGRSYFDEVLAAREGLRATLAGLLDVSTDNVALTTSTTESCNVVMTGLCLERGDEVVTTDVEHFGLLGPLHASGARVRVAEIRSLAADRALDVILAACTPRTRLIALSHVAWTTGHVLPVYEIRRALPDVRMLVDGAQSVGTVPVDVGPFDFYTVSGQKWLCGPSPTGALYVRDPDRLDVGMPSYFSQDGYERDGRFTPKAGAARFDPAWISPAFVAGLEAAIAARPEWAFERAAQAAARCRDLLAERVEVVTEPGQATLVTFRPNGDAEAVAASLLERRVIVRDLPGTGWVRASCGYWTSDEDLERLLAALTA